MENTGNRHVPSKRRKRRTNHFRNGMILVSVLLVLLLAGCLLAGFWRLQQKDSSAAADMSAPEQTAVSTETTKPIDEDATKAFGRIREWETGYLASEKSEAAYYDIDGTALGELTRGVQVEYKKLEDGRMQLQVDGENVYIRDDADIVSDADDVVLGHTLYAKSPANLRDAEGKLLTPLIEKGDAVEIIGCDYLNEDGTVHLYRVRVDGEDGYIMPWYLVDTQEEADAVFNRGLEKLHGGREDLYGGGGAANLDYYPREKGPIEGNVMPEECRTLYVISGAISQIDEYIEIANASDINAFVVDITDGGAVGYASDVMKAYCPTGASQAINTVEEYRAAIQKIKDAGYYVIGRITTFNDTCFVEDHPELAISDKEGNPLLLSGEYWPTAYSRTVWQYKVDLAVEAVELMGFNEIQYDYVRFPDLTWEYEEAGTIDFHNLYGETKAQAIQRFLMYAADILHEKGVYVSADVFGESAYNYVTAYGQYWPAITNVVDAISAMPYPDHFASSGSWLPWEHPYDTLYDWGSSAMNRQIEIPTPAAVRTWIQAYDAIYPPYNTYGPDEIAAQIQGLRDAGCTGGYLTWNAFASLEKYRSLIPAFTAADS